MLVEEVHEDATLVTLGKLAGLMRFGQAVDDALLDAEACDQLVECVKVAVDAEVDKALPLPVLTVFLEHDDVEIASGVDAHGVGSGGLGPIWQSGLGAEGYDRHDVEPALEVGPWDADLQVVEPARIPGGPVLLQDLAGVDLGGEQLRDTVAVDRAVRMVGHPLPFIGVQSGRTATAREEIRPIFRREYDPYLLPEFGRKITLWRSPFSAGSALESPVPLVRSLVGLVDTVVRQGRVRQLEDTLVIGVAQSLSGHRLGDRVGLVQFVEDQEVRRHRLHADLALHAPHVEVGVTDTLQAGGVGVGHELREEGVVEQERAHPALRELQHVGSGREEVDDVQAANTGVQAAQDGQRAAADLSRLRQDNMLRGIVVDGPQIFVSLERERPALEADLLERPVGERVSE